MVINMQTLRLLAPLRTTDTKRGKQFYVYQYYVDMFKKINVELIFVSPLSLETYQQFASLCDGLFLAGGLDINACFYHEKNHESNHLEIIEVDQMDIELLHLFNQLQKPVIGICRGLQVINVAFGGTLYQDINSQCKTSLCHQQSDHQKYSHQIHIVPHSLLSHYFKEFTTVNSFHHQAIKDLAEGFQVMAYSEDGLIEAIEKKDIIALQWHPEKINDDNQNKILHMFLDFFKESFH